MCDYAFEWQVSLWVCPTADEVLAVENIFKNVGVEFIRLLWRPGIMPSYLGPLSIAASVVFQKLKDAFKALSKWLY